MKKGVSAYKKDSDAKIGIMLSGGKLLAQGSYGCVYTSAMPCKGKQPTLEKDADHPPLTKIILKDDAEQEFKIANIIRDIPIHKNYFAVAEAICEPATKQKESLSGCTVLKEVYPKYKRMNTTMKQFRLLPMHNYGVEMADYRFQLKGFNLMNFIVHFVEAGALLTLHGIVHNDIHMGNILIDKRQVPRLIDFNLAAMVDNHPTARELSRSYNPAINQESPDFSLTNGIRQGKNPSNIIEDIIKKKPIIKFMTTLLHINPTEMTEKLDKLYQKSRAVQTGNLEAWFQHYWRLMDSWSIGTGIVYFLTRLTLWPEFQPILQQTQPRIIPVLRQMCQVSPLDRIDCVQALYQLRPDSFIITRYASKWLDKVGRTPKST